MRQAFVINPTESPCSACSKDLCKDCKCPEWQSWFSQSWDATTSELRFRVWTEIDSRGKRSFCYYLPHELKDPCPNCVCKDWCDTPCSLRLKWWNKRMAQIRATLPAKADEKGGEQR